MQIRGASTGRFTNRPWLASGAAALTAFLTFPAAAQPGLPPVQFPPENPFSESKRVLGKILFWDEQLSSDNMVSCATCHMPNNGGADARRSRIPGVDNLLNSPDDIFGSPGVSLMNAAGDYQRQAFHGLNPQVTNRSAPSAINAAFANDLFWDGRARSTFIDPQTGQIAIQNGGFLENQAVAPITNSVEMAHTGRDWNQVVAKLTTARPLAAATALPSDVVNALQDRPTYPDLFARAFGDGNISARRIAFAIATYERTLISNDTPFDRFQQGQTNALTPGQVQGMNFLQNSACNICHTGPLFTNQTFRNVGLRPPAEDPGRQNVTNAPNGADRGKFKVPSLRNVGLRRQFMHNGQFTTLTQVIQFYARAPGAAPQFPENRDPAMPGVNVPPNVAPALQDFLTNGLTDARVANQTFPFDRPQLYFDRPADRPVVLTGGVAGSGAFVPAIIAQNPPFVGNADFKVVLDGALGGASARLAVSTSPPVNSRVSRDTLLGPVIAAGTGAGNGLATLHWPLEPGVALPGQTVFAQWIVADPAAPGGEALSAPVQIRFFCGATICPPACPADWDGSGAATASDVAAFVNDWLGSLAGNNRLADFNKNNVVEPTDVATFVSAWFEAISTGC